MELQGQTSTFTAVQKRCTLAFLYLKEWHLEIPSITNLDLKRRLSMSSETFHQPLTLLSTTNATTLVIWVSIRKRWIIVKESPSSESTLELLDSHLCSEKDSNFYLGLDGTLNFLITLKLWWVATTLTMKTTSRLSRHLEKFSGKPNVPLFTITPWW